jgi:hypothetical protein
VSYDIDWFCLAATNNTQGSVELPHELIARLAAHPGDLVLEPLHRSIPVLISKPNQANVA